MPTKKAAKSNKSVIEHRTSKIPTTIIGALVETQRSIADMARVFAELPAGNRLGVGGTRKLTRRQAELLRIIGHSQRRADQLVDVLRRQGQP